MGSPGGRGLPLARLRQVVVVLLSLSLVSLVAAILLRPPETHRPSRSAIRLVAVSPEKWDELRSHGHRVGPAPAPVELVFFTDYECPFCRRTERTVRAVRAAFPGRLAILYRHYPLRNHQPEAYEKARVAECAAALGRFSRVQDLLYERVLNGPEAIDSVAREAGITDRRFLECAADTGRVPAIDRDLELIRAIGTRRAPSIFIAGRLLSDTPDSTLLHAIVDSLLDAS